MFAHHEFMYAAAAFAYRKPQNSAEQRIRSLGARSSSVQAPAGDRVESLEVMIALAQHRRNAVELQGARRTRNILRTLPCSR